MLAASVLTVIWSVSSLLALTESSAWWLGAQAADILRYLCWTVFVALFFRTNAGQANDGWYRWWPGLVVVGLSAPRRRWS
jgi:hypothetical protein